MDTTTTALPARRRNRRRASDIRGGIGESKSVRGISGSGFSPYQGIRAGTTGMTQSNTMFERYGGLPFVTRFVLGFYDRVLASPGLSPYFANVDMQRLVEHQAKFISSVMGGPASYSNAALREAHSHLHIDDRAFDEMIGVFRSMLED